LGKLAVGRPEIGRSSATGVPRFSITNVSPFATFLRMSLVLR